MGNSGESKFIPILNELAQNGEPLIAEHASWAIDKIQNKSQQIMINGFKSRVIENKIKKITDRIVKNINPDKIIVFGPYAYGNPNNDSDLDLLIILKKDYPRHLSCSVPRTICYP